MNKYIFNHIKLIFISLLIGFGISYAVHTSARQNLIINLETETDSPQTLQLFYTTNKSENFSEKSSLKKRITQANELEKISFALPVGRLHLLRLDFGKGPGNIKIKDMSVKNFGKLNLSELPAFRNNQLDTIEFADNILTIKFTGEDPYLVLSPKYVKKITGFKKTSLFLGTLIFSGLIMLLYFQRRKVGQNALAAYKHLAGYKNLWLFFVIFIFTALIIYLRSPDMWRFKIFWAEDGNIFFNEAQQYGFESLWRVFSGRYLYLIPRIEAWLLSFFKDTYIPHLYLFSVVLTFSFVIFGIIRSLDFSWYKKYFIGLLVLLTPCHAELFDNINNLQWPLSLLLLTLLAVKWDINGGQKKLLISVLIISLCLTGAFSVIFLPLVIIKLLWERNLKKCFSVYTAYAIGAAIQMFCLITSPRLEGKEVGAEVDWLEFPKFLYEIFLHLSAYFPLSAISILWLSWLLFITLRKKNFKLKELCSDNGFKVSLFLLAGGMLVLISTFAAEGTLKSAGKIEALYNYNGIRYSYGLYFAILTSMLLLAKGRNLIVSLILITAVCVSSFQTRKFDDIYWDSHLKLSHLVPEIRMSTQPVVWGMMLHNDISERKPDTVAKSSFNTQNLCPSAKDIGMLIETQSNNVVLLKTDTGKIFKYLYPRRFNDVYRAEFAMPVGKGLNLSVIGKELKEIKIYCL